MGMYDMIIDKDIDIQIKLLDCVMKVYSKGDTILLDDGVYIGWEGYFVVEDNTIIFIDNRIYDKWGSCLKCEDVIQSRNPLREIQIKPKESVKKRLRI